MITHPSESEIQEIAGELEFDRFMNIPLDNWITICNRMEKYTVRNSINAFHSISKRNQEAEYCTEADHDEVHIRLQVLAKDLHTLVQANPDLARTLNSLSQAYQNP